MSNETSYQEVGTESIDSIEEGVNNTSSTTPLIHRSRNSSITLKLRSGTATLSSCISNLCNTILGTGMLAMPHAFASGGLLPGIITVIWCGLTAALGLYFLSRSAGNDKVPHRNASFASLSKLTYPKMGKVFDLAIFLKCYGVSISYLIIIGSLMPRVITSFYPSARTVPLILLDRRLWILISMTVLCPVAFVKKLDSLKYISYIALTSVANLLFVVTFKFFVPTGMPERPPIKYVDLGPKMVSSLPVQIFAFTCAQNIFAVHNELKDNSQKRLNKVIGSSIGAATIIYQILGILGFLSFGGSVGSNIIEMYPHSLLVSICQLGIVILVLFSYPLQLHPCRASLDKVIRTQLEDSIEEDDNKVRGDHGEGAEEIPLGWFVIETSFILFTTFLISLFVEKLETVLGFVGATGSTTISFILPSLFFLSLFRHSESKHDQLLCKFAVGLLIWGITVMVVSLSLNIYHLVSPEDVDGHSLAVLGALGGKTLAGLTGGN